ncbi:glycosyltransferase family 2 protein [Ligilactobacillus sp. WILCCON 0076]|uniref:Glycosyltransferase family 2 protein n=1 Tax=Ligilactobacillus ubinensis TaxID=2876789 RepID=A0A9X2JNW2_9LACO|nr:glycosyltransferase family 2 protein [Ligilactobacillus ubinensis]MCP0887611.1 glycosyltransferase family 2 protein [Ligilactobacillus ubinensis]
MFLNREFLDACTQRTSLVISLHKVQNQKFRKFCDSKALLILGCLNFLRLLFLKKLKSNPKYELAVVAIVKNEGLYLEEWLKYYYSIGVGQCYIYDNDSSDNTKQILKKYDDFVTYKKISGAKRQYDAYNDALNHYRKDCKLMAMIDGDEFIFCPPNNTKVIETISSYFKDKSIGGLGVNWEIFGSSHLENKPDGLVTDNFVYRAENTFEKNKHIKTICDPNKVVGFINPHYATYLPGYKAINENGKVVTGAFTHYVSTNIIRVNHYFTKSKAEFVLKKARGMADNLSIRNSNDFKMHDKNDVLDESMKKYNQLNGLD